MLIHEHHDSWMSIEQVLICIWKYWNNQYGCQCMAELRDRSKCKAISSFDFWIVLTVTVFCSLSNYGKKTTRQFNVNNQRCWLVLGWWAYHNYLRHNYKWCEEIIIVIFWRVCLSSHPNACLSYFYTQKYSKYNQHKYYYPWPCLAPKTRRNPWEIHVWSVYRIKKSPTSLTSLTLTSTDNALCEGWRRFQTLFVSRSKKLKTPDRIMQNWIEWRVDNGIGEWKREPTCINLKRRDFPTRLKH